MDVVLVAAVGENHAIGLENSQVWTSSEDLRRFRSITLNHPVVMGRNTFESIGAPLDDRINIVLSSDASFSPPGVIVCSSLEDVFVFCQKFDTVFFIGGAQVFEQVIDSATRLELTLVHESFEADRFFPEIDDSWKKVSEEYHGSFSFVSFVR